MKDCFKNSLFFPILFVTATVVLAISHMQLNISYGEAVPLIPINTGNATLDKGLPVFYDCIDKKIDNSKGDEADSYFDSEPTKNEVTTCYYEVFFYNSGDHSSDDSSDEHSNDSTEG